MLAIMGGADQGDKQSGPVQKPQNIIRLIEKALKAQRAISAFDREQESITGAVNAVKHTVNEFEELYLDTLIVYYVSLHYMKERKYLEAVHLSKHTLQQIENCIDFVQRSESGLGALKEGVVQ
mmetsp:Transcript_9233/g.11225  ORF Transcript_9233/g.11225 Transcript_9233/m.11225 type:complete len:123 (-) Transcript_9233:634-1002(-)